MANIAANDYKGRKILKRHKNFMPDRPSVRRPNNTGRIEFHAGQRPMSDTYFKPCIPPENIRKSEGFLMFSGGIEKYHRAVMG